LCEFANGALKSESQFKSRYATLKARRGHKRTIVAIAHKLMEIIFVLLQKKQPYRDPNIDYEKLVVDRNSSRWLKALHKYGYLKQQAFDIHA
jgi:transposase